MQLITIKTQCSRQNVTKRNKLKCDQHLKEILNWKEQYTIIKTIKEEKQKVIKELKEKQKVIKQLKEKQRK